MSINVVVSSTAAGVTVSGSTAVAITVGGGTGVSVGVTSGIGPAGFITAPGTATNAFGTFQLKAGDGVTITTAAGEFVVASYNTAAVAGLAPVQTVQGRTGAVTLTRADLTAAAETHTHNYVTAMNGLTGTLTIAAGSGVTVSTASSSITIAAGGGGGSGGGIAMSYLFS